MPNLHELREHRAGKVDAMRAIHAKAATEKRDLSDDEQSAFDTSRTEVEKLERDIRNAEFLAEAERRAHAEPVTGNGGDAQFQDACRSFSLVRAIASQVPGLDVDAGREREVSQELQKRSGRTAQGIMVPTAVFEKRVVTTAAPAGGPGSNIIGTDHRGDLYIDRLRAALVIGRLGATVLNDLRGNVDIPRMKASATGYWVAENQAITVSDPQFDKVSLTPKHVGALTEFSRNMLMQTSPDIEELLRRDFAALLANALDTAAIMGGGTNEPTGVLTTAGIGDVPGGTNGVALNWANIIALIAEVSGENALDGRLAFLTNSKVVKAASTTLKTTADTSSNFILSQPDALAGYPLAVTNNVPSNIAKGTGNNLSALIFGNWADLLIGYWSAFDVLVNPYETTAYAKGNVQIRGMLTADIAVRHPESFAAIKDIVAP